jgi:hypothetical protein
VFKGECKTSKNNQQGLFKKTSIVAFSLLQAHTLECFQSKREFYEFVNLMGGWLALILAAVLGP